MTPWSLGAAAATVLAVLAWRPPGPWLVRARLPAGPAEVPVRALAGIAAAVATAGLLTLLPRALDALAPALVGGTAVLVAVFAARQVAAARRRRSAAATRADLCDALDLLAAELGAGIAPGAALAGVSTELPALVPAARAARQGHDVAPVLAAAADHPGAAVLRDVAAAWQVAERSGAPLAAVLHRLAATVRDDLELDREVRAECAPARATGRLMAGLPVLGLGLGAGLGVDPVRLVTTTVPGAACLAAGAALACAGVAWVERVAASAEAGG